MCGRSQFRKVPEIIEEFGPARVGDIGDPAIADEAFPKSVVPGLVLHKGERVISAFSWAFFDDGTGHNARARNGVRPARLARRLRLRPAGPPAGPLRRGTGLVLRPGRRHPGRRRPLPPRSAPAGGPPRRATMLTRPADDVVAPFHERMPVILPSDLIAPWLAGEAVPSTAC